MAAQQGAARLDRRDAGPYRRLHLRQPREPHLRRDDGRHGRPGPRPDHDERDLGRPRELAGAGRAARLRRARRPARRRLCPHGLPADLHLLALPARQRARGRRGRRLGGVERRHLRQQRARRPARRSTRTSSTSASRSPGGRRSRASTSTTGRKAHAGLDVELPEGADDAFWPLLGYLAGLASPDRIPLLRGLAGGSARARRPQGALRRLRHDLGRADAARRRRHARGGRRARRPTPTAWRRPGRAEPRLASS